MKDPLAPRRFNADLPGARIVFAPGSVLELPTEVRRLGVGRAFVVTTGGRSASMTPPDDLLGEMLAGHFRDAKEHVPVATVARALKSFRACEADVCVAIGGGSPIGLGKAIARETGVPLVAVPTTYSGSEMTSIWGETGESGKQTGRDPKARPRLVIYDVTLTLGLPAAVSGASGMNAMAHAVEAMYSATATRETLAIAEEAIGLLANNLPTVVADGRNVIARSNTLAGAHLAGRSLDECSMGLHHRICHVLGGTFKLPHARTHAVLLPHVVRFNTPAAPDAMTRIGRALGNPDAAAALADLNRTVGIRGTLRELGLREPDIEPAADEVASSAYPNPRTASREDVAGILRAAY